MNTNLNSIAMPVIGLSSFVGSKAGYAHASVAFAGARTTDLPVPVPRGAPV
ncbi:MAG: hypothetical protein H7323_05195 [Frankiales bacterium]|nr:hypothetical protein [Frankiales bacterium]